MDVPYAEDTNNYCTYLLIHVFFLPEDERKYC